MESGKEAVTQVKARFEALSKGEYYPKKVTPAQAKERLRETDPGLDISPLLKAEDGESLKRGAVSLAAQSADLKMLSYFSPIAIDVLEKVLALLNKKV
ncbi:MAG: hypothetical protein L3J42_07740 [Hydrogenimonas sp.]|nr:hypothetical protein [Hydrogenimonas sp.]